ncbi:MAG: helix-turn-helix transcriptional regulator [Spirochaetota bacterium]
MDATTGSAIISPAAVAQTVAVFVGAAALGIGAFLYATHRTAVLRTYLVFLASIFLFVLSFWFREIGEAVTALVSVAAEPVGSASRIVRTLGGASFLAEAVAGIVLVVVLPRLTHGLFNRGVPGYRRVIAVATALLMAMLALTVVAAPVGWAPVVLVSVMYATVAASIAQMAVWIAGRGRDPSATTERGADPAAGTVAAIRTFLLVSAIFLPLFVADVVISSSGVGWADHPIVRALDNLSVPLYFVILASGSVVFAYRFLNEPPLMADEQVSAFGRERYGLTEREAEVVEYVMEGFSVADAATAMKISPKTVENHLYSVYRKIGVTNRIQLYNFFENRRSL